MEPYNYIINTAQQPNFETGFAQGQAMKQAEQQKQAQAAMQADLLQLSTAPTVANISSVMAKYPQVAEKFKPLLDNATEQQRQNRIGQASDVYASLLAGRSDIAKQLLQEHADAARNAGDERGAKSAEVMVKILDSGGDAGKNMALSSAGMFLSAAMGADKFAETFSKISEVRREDELHPAKLTEQQATAAKAATAAKFAESDAALDLQKKGWDITKIQNDIAVSKQNAKIALMNAQIARETNDLKRQELALKVQDAKAERDEKVRNKATEALNSAESIDNMLSTAQMVLNAPGIVWYSATGPVASKLPTVTDETADFEEQIETLKSQAFITQVKAMRAGVGSTGLGQLTEKEGAKLESAMQNLSLRQSSSRLRSNVEEIQRLLLKARKRLETQYGVPLPNSDLRPGVDQRTVPVEY